MKSIASSILIIIISGLVTTLWAFHKEITKNSVKIETIEKESSSAKDDIKYIRSRIDRIYDHLIESN